MSFSILTATRFGVPNLVRCDDCSVIWERPHGDRYADTLAHWATEHRVACAGGYATSR